jgi:cystathionine beta-lyase/cystathionine gamma-synthase
MQILRLGCASSGASSLQDDTLGRYLRCKMKTKVEQDGVSATRQSDATKCVHAGEDRHGKAAPITTEIAQTSVFVLPNVEELRKINEGTSSAFMYTRYANPTTEAAEQKIAALEGAAGCVVSSSGQAATLATILALCQAGDEVVSMLDLYGGTLALFEKVFSRYGVTVKFVPFQELDNVEKYFTTKTKLLFLETPTNPTLRCVDVEALVKIARRHCAYAVVDNTFATPILQKPLELGADVSIHSATKYLGGHSDLTAGAVACNGELVERIREMRKISGGALDPGASYLLIRGLKTLELRVERASRNAMQIAQVLEGNPKVKRVMYPGLPSHPAHALARRQMRDFGMMMAIEVGGGGKAAERFIDGLQLWYLAASLGGVESTVSYPVLSSHAHMSEDKLRLMDVSPATVRLSVGIEDPADLIADLEQSLARC